MKLAEALLTRKNISAHISELRSRWNRAAVHDEGDKPEESPEGVLGAIMSDLAQYETLMVQINKTNNAVKVGDRTMMEAIARRDVLKWQHAHLAALAETIRSRNEHLNQYASDKALRKVVTEGVDIAAINKSVNDTAAELRSLDAQIQAVNWTEGLLE